MPDDRSSGFVYHYTSVEGMMGIVGLGRLYATELVGLNDRAEVNHGLERLPELLRRHGKHELQDELQVALEKDRSREVFVACASDRSDDVGQWDRYASHGRGYSIAIDTSADLVVSSRGFRPPPENRFFDGCNVSGWQPVLYSQNDIDYELESWVAGLEARLEAFDESFQRAIHNNDSEAVSENSYDRHSELLTAATELAHRMKHEGFSGERELRIIATTDSPSAIYFRPASYGVVRFVELANGGQSRDSREILYSRTDCSLQLPIEQVIIGPGLDERGISTLRDYLNVNGYREGELVAVSGAEFRAG